jgi:hypothetical protein
LPGPRCRHARWPLADALAVLLLPIVLATGCTAARGGEAAQQPANQTLTTMAGQAEAAQASATTAVGQPAPATGPVVASAEKGDLPGITLAVNQLRRSDPNTVTVVFTIANQDGEPPVFDWTWGELGVIDVGNALAFDVSGVYVVEPQGKKKYLVLRDTNTRCICSTGVFRSGSSSGLTRGTAATFFAKFPAPPAGVTTMSVVIPHFPVLDNVPLAS